MAWASTYPTLRLSLADIQHAAHGVERRTPPRPGTAGRSHARLRFTLRDESVVVIIDRPFSLGPPAAVAESFGQPIAVLAVVERETVAPPDRTVAGAVGFSRQVRVARKQLHEIVVLELVNRL